MKKLAVVSSRYDIFYEITSELKRSFGEHNAREGNGSSLMRRQKRLVDYIEPGEPIPHEVYIIVTTQGEREALEQQMRAAHKEPAGDGETSSELEGRRPEARTFDEYVFEERVKHFTIFTLPDDYSPEDIKLSLKRGLSILAGNRHYRSLILGIDPGPTPGIAVYGDHQLLYSCATDLPEDCAGVVAKVLRMFPARGALVRIGHGDEIIRNRIINSLLKLDVMLEIVDESRTSYLSVKGSHVEAAKRIAFSGGGKMVQKSQAIRPSHGYIQDLKRKSRKLSGGQFSISTSLAWRVARGELSLEEAVRVQGEGKKKKWTGDREES